MSGSTKIWHGGVVANSHQQPDPELPPVSEENKLLARARTLRSLISDMENELAEVEEKLSKLRLSCPPRMEEGESLYSVSPSEPPATPASGFRSRG